jgi:hypothetical protein
MKTHRRMGRMTAIPYDVFFRLNARLSARVDRRKAVILSATGDGSVGCRGFGKWR